MQGMVAANVFGRDEDDSVMELRQQDVDEAVGLFLNYLDGRFSWSMKGEWSDVVLDIR
eukprot:COSAG04_NODE_5005_length_1784_cov_1.227300_4_plen_58_part_00